MKQKYRIKERVSSDNNMLLESIQNGGLKQHQIFHVQKRFWGFLWLNIKSFEDKNDDWWAWGCAQNLLDKLNEED